MPRTTTTRVRRAYGPRKKYSLARTCAASSVSCSAGGTLGAQQMVSIVASAAAQGKRKCKNFDINLACRSATAADQEGSLIYYALVYVPAGTTAATLNATSGSELYTPAANVLAAGIYDVAKGTGFRVRTRLARNLNAGDEIQLVLRGTNYGASVNTVNLSGVITYVVAYN